MSHLYWKNLKNDPQEDSQLLKEFQSLSEKIKEQYPDHHFLCEINLASSIPGIDSKQKNDKHQKKYFMSPKNLQHRVTARITKDKRDNSENIGIKHINSSIKPLKKIIHIRRASCITESILKRQF